MKPELGIRNLGEYLETRFSREVPDALTGHQKAFVMKRMASVLSNYNSYRAYVAHWLQIERREYADKKYAPGSPEYIARLEDIKANGIGPDSTEMVFLTNYLKRAELLGIDKDAGRQAFGKFVVTATAMLERIVEAYGEMPKPGLTTGEIEPWE